MGEGIKNALAPRRRAPRDCKPQSGAVRLFVFCGETETWGGLSADSASVNGIFSEGADDDVLNLKDLLTVLHPSGRAAFSGLVERLEVKRSIC